MSRSGTLRSFAVLAAAVAVTFGYQACAPSNFQSRNTASVDQAGGKNAGLSGGGTTTDNPKPTVDVVINGYDTSGVQNPRLCLGQIQVGGQAGSALAATKTAERDPSSTPGSCGENFFNALWSWLDNSLFAQDFSDLDRLLALLPEGTFLTSMNLPVGQYDQIDLALNTTCPGGSLSLQNQSGTITMSEPLTVHFSGDLRLDPGTERLTLDIGPVLSDLASARDRDDVRRILRRTYGRF